MKAFLSLILVFCVFVKLNAGTSSSPRCLINSPNYYFVETGTHSGGGVQEAISSSAFIEIYSMEVNKNLVDSVQGLYINNSDVTIVQGDSYIDLDDILQYINLPATFWLDARYSNYASAEHYYNSGITANIEPLLGELDLIKAHGINTHTILINDINQILNIYSTVFTLTDIQNKLYEINPNYVLEYVNGGNTEPLPGNVLKASIP